MSSSSPPTAPGSRSPSPETPGSSHDHDQIVIQHDCEISPWFHSTHSRTLSDCATWELDGNPCFMVTKDDEQHMLPLSELIQEHAYDDSPPSQFTCNLPKFLDHSLQEPAVFFSDTNRSSFLVSSPSLAPQTVTISPTKPIPPPVSRPRKRDFATVNQRVVCPPKESCFGMRIIVPNIPESGTKSRVETQIRVTIDLADTNSLSSDPSKYDRIGSWKWLQLPPGTATKRRTRKQGKIDPLAQDILYLTATVGCASPPQNRVLSCSSCQAREAKRVARKLAARVRPARSETDSPEESSSHPHKNKLEDTTSIIQFQCAEILDFSTGTVVLPLRITCYCRHHREKVGFLIHFSMMDCNGRDVGSGVSGPIMITDDHKTSSSIHKGLQNGFTDPAWSAPGMTSEVTDNTLSRHRATMKGSRGEARKRAKPYDGVRNNGISKEFSREASVCSMASPATSCSPLPLTRSPTPPPYQTPSFLTTNPSALYGSEAPLDPDPPSVAPSNLVVPSHENGVFAPPPGLTIPELQANDRTPTPAITRTPLIPPIRPPFPMPISSPSQPPPVQPMPFLYFDPISPTSIPALPIPRIHRLIPACGPTHGGIEVTILGTNFHASLQLNCIFGDVPASSTQRWSDNTLVCVLPPRPAPGVVAVWFDGFPKNDDNAPPSLFTYSDESDRALMELALQVVGLKMTGKLEDAKNVAMRIVGNASDPSDSNHVVNGSDMMQLSKFPLPTRDIRQLLLSHAGDSTNFENLIVRFLSILDTPLECHSTTSISSALSHSTSSGQTLLHIACFLGYVALVNFLILRGIDMDSRDRNGLTALHFAVLGKSKQCARLLVEAGADMEIVNVLGKTAQEETSQDFFDEISFGSGRAESYAGDAEDDDDDDENQWGDAEDNGPENAPRAARCFSERRALTLDVPALEHGRREPDVDAIDEPPAPSAQMKRVANEKQAASFVDVIQRAVAQLHAQGIMPNMPQLPLPGLPHLPGMPTVPWGALPHIPVFPVFVPLPGWPSFLGEKRAESEDGSKDQRANHSSGPGAIKTAQDWVNAWMTVAVATATRQQNEQAPPPAYSPREDRDREQEGRSFTYPPLESHEPAPVAVPPTPVGERPMRRVGYDDVPVADQEVNSFGYQPTGARAQRLQKKKDRMLMIFWLPILLLSLLWAFHSGVQFVYRTAKTASPLKVLLRG